MLTVESGILLSFFFNLDNYGFLLFPSSKFQVIKGNKILLIDKVIELSIIMAKWTLIMLFFFFSKK